ncbi:MAG: serine hydrolase domain-containing protein [Polyangiaceae bacterium]
MPDQRFSDDGLVVGSSVDREKLRSAASDLEAELAPLISDAPGSAIGLIDRNGLVVSILKGSTQAAGGTPISLKTRFEVGSVTKSFTASAVLALVQQGKLKLDGPADQYLPALAGVRYPSRDSPRITLRHLLTHTSGLPRVGPLDTTHDPGEAEVLQSLDGLALVRAPGTLSDYSNLGYIVLAQVIRAVTGEAYEKFVEEQVLKPLGSDATFSPGPAAASGYSRGASGPRPEKSKQRGAAGGSGGLWGSLEDVARFASWQLQAWPPSSDPEFGPLSRATRRLAHTAAWPLPARLREHHGLNYSEARAVGLGWQVYERCDQGRVVWHNGVTNGFAAAVYLAVESGVGVVVLANLRDAKVDQISRTALAFLADHGLVRAEMERAGPAIVAAAKDAVGLYNHWDAARYTEGFSEGFRELLPPEAMAAALASKRAKFGVCRPLDASQIAEVRSPDHVIFRLECERGQPLMIVHGAAFGRPRVDLWVVDPGKDPLEQSSCGVRPGSEEQ